MITGTRVRSLTSVTLAAVLFSSIGAGCSLFSQPPPPGDAAQALAAGLATGNVSGVAFSGTTPAKATAFLTSVYKGMGTLRPKVTVAGVTTSEGSEKATATLRTVWDVSDSPTDWTYEEKVPMTLVDDTWRVTWSPRIVAPDLAADEALTLKRVWPKRADIEDASGGKIMTEREVSTVGLDKAKLGAGEAAASARALARVLGIDAQAYAAKVASAGAKAFVPALTLRASDPALTRNTGRIDAVKGALRLASLQVLAPSRTWAAPILGNVSEATAEQITASKGVLAPGDSVGQNGLQYRYDAQLRGTPGLSVLALKKGADGSVIAKRELFAEESKDGQPLKITLDPKAQSAAEAALAGQTQRPTALVAVRVSTGEILAAAVGPGADGAPVALAGKAAPGSTFKMVSSLALIRKGLNADSPLPCTQSLTVNGRVFANYTDYPKDHFGNIPLKTALAFSCNTAFISQYKTVSQDDLIAAAQSLGMGDKLDLPFTGFVGSVPTTDNVVEHAASFIGQGRVEASPLTMAIVLASAMKGATVRPKLVVGSQDLPAPATPLDPREAEVLRQELREVVAVGSGRVLQQVGVEYAKTGTAEFGTDNPPQTHTWMVAGRGDIAIAAYNEVGDNGVTGSAPFIISFLKAYNLR
ncbi:penicillin-binding protein [Intrasporangium oryzae NRRL B-24470]|uniref:Penicillin-binding protein n=1 Tax=Intrasporangium oryzae NRRL B-24470 TaxID=1386089 RepID=W9G763_9MICO|nr:penicillin-binding transpeptidase domain-containing protein [Intrasporangium oryzae]EWS99718.1 penicillin-binding protein [Intrasporangium oryzae NRRL B-24470]